MEGRHLDPHLQGLPERLPLLLEQCAELAAERILAAELAGCIPAVLGLHNRPVRLQDCLLSYQEAEVYQP